MDIEGGLPLSWVGEGGFLEEEVLGTVVTAFSGILNPHYLYLTSLKGLSSILRIPNLSSLPPQISAPQESGYQPPCAFITG